MYDLKDTSGLIAQFRDRERHLDLSVSIESILNQTNNWVEIEINFV